MLGEVKAFRRSEWREEGRLDVCQSGDLEVDAARRGTPLMARQPSSHVTQDKTPDGLPPILFGTWSEGTFGKLTACFVQGTMLGTVYHSSVLFTL